MKKSILLTLFSLFAIVLSAQTAEESQKRNLTQDEILHRMPHGITKAISAPIEWLDNKSILLTKLVDNKRVVNTYNVAVGKYESYVEDEVDTQMELLPILDAVNVSLSPDYNSIAYTKNNNLFV